MFTFNVFFTANKYFDPVIANKTRDLILFIYCCIHATCKFKLVCKGRAYKKKEVIFVKK